MSLRKGWGIIMEGSGNIQQYMVQYSIYIFNLDLNWMIPNKNKAPIHQTIVTNQPADNSGGGKRQNN